MHLTCLEWLNPAHAALLKSALCPGSAQPARPREEFCRPSLTCRVTGSYLAPVLWLDVETETPVGDLVGTQQADPREPSQGLASGRQEAGGGAGGEGAPRMRTQDLLAKQAQHLP